VVGRLRARAGGRVAAISIRPRWSSSRHLDTSALVE